MKGYLTMKSLSGEGKKFREKKGKLGKKY